LICYLHIKKKKTNIKSAKFIITKFVKIRNNWRKIQKMKQIKVFNKNKSITCLPNFDSTIKNMSIDG